MARLYFDHNVSLKVAPLLEVAGHDVVVARHLGRERSPDDAMLLSSVRASRVFIPHNRHDFKMLHDAWLTWPAAFDMVFPPHPGILVLDAALPETLARVLAAFLSDTPPERLADGIFWWHRRDGWRASADSGRWEPYLLSAAEG